MPNEHTTLTSLFSDIADSIRAKTGSSDTIIADEFPDAIDAIPTGGSDTPIPENDVTFYDYDGTVVASYTAAEFAQLEAMPPNPTHEGLTAQGWNWDLADAKEYVADYGGQNIAQMHITNDGKTRIFIHLVKDALSPKLGICPNGSVTVDWGDDGATNTVTGTSSSTVIYTQHTYPREGDYVITIDVPNYAELGFAGNTTIGSFLLVEDENKSGMYNRTYQGAVVEVRLGNNCIIRSSALQYLMGLERISIPNGVSTNGQYWFAYCYSLAFIGFPKSFLTIGSYMLTNMTALKVVSFPKTINSMGSSASFLGSSFSIRRIYLWDDGLAIFRNTFSRNYSIYSVTIPKNFTEIGANSFNECYGLRKLIFTSLTPPTVSASSVFSTLPIECEIYVPQGTKSAYESEQNYPDPNTYRYFEY